METISLNGNISNFQPDNAEDNVQDNVEQVIETPVFEKSNDVKMSKEQIVIIRKLRQYVLVDAW